MDESRGVFFGGDSEMTKREILLARNALRALDGAGPAGLGREALMEHTGTFAESIVSRVEAQALERLLLGRGWAERWTDSLTGNLRFILTENGRVAMGAL